MIHNPYYSREVQGPYELTDIGDLRLEEGGTLRSCKLGYITFGTLDADKQNAILVPTWYSGTHQVMSQVYIGKEHALNPERYFIIVVNQLEGDVLSPYVLGKTLSLHPLAILLALSAGTISAGIIGAILAVPFAAVAWSAITTWRSVENDEAPAPAADSS